MTEAAREFTYAAQAVRVVFGAGSLRHLERELDALAVDRPVVLGTPRSEPARRLAARLGIRSAGLFAGAVMHVPQAVVDEALAFVRQRQADALIAFGGGSAIGLAKAVALAAGLPIVAIPTTYAGSEMTPVHGITRDGVKQTGRDPRVQPRTVLYDPELGLGLPLAVSVTSALNAMAHAVEGLYAQDGNPVMDLVAHEGIRALAAAIPALHRDAADLGARSDALYGAWLAGTVLGNVGMALHHKLCHALGGSFGLPHADVHAVILPHAVAFNAPAAPAAMLRISDALRVDPAKTTAAQALHALARDHGAPVSLKALGMAGSDLDRAADLVVSRPYWNPRPAGPERRADVRALLQRAFDGHAPAA